MIVSGHQPSYLPWLGFFEKIVRSDIFVFHDTAQFEKGGFLHRNKIKTSNGTLWLTVPVDLSDYQTTELRNIRIIDSEKWRRKHWKAIYYNYAKAPFFKEYQDFLFEYFSKPRQYLIELSMEFIYFVIKELNIKTRLEFVSQNPSIMGRKSDFVLSLCKAFDARVYYSGIHGKDYLNEEDFQRAGIKIVYQSFQYPEYPQMFNKQSFVPNLSILDCLLNCGPQMTLKIIEEGGKQHEYTCCGSSS